MPSLIKLPADDTCLLYLIRHGATPHNQMSPPRLQGSGVDESLSELGQKHAERVAAVLAERPIARVCSSPMKRAQETAAAIAKPHDVEVETIDSLIEVNVGRWEGKSWPEIETTDPVNYAKFRADPAVHGYPDGETMASVIERVDRIFNLFMREMVGKEIVAVAHSVVIRSYLASLMGLPPARGYEVPAENCAINLVRYRGGKAKVVTVNAVNHLM